MRHHFSKRKISLPLPDLSSIQRDSYNWLKTEGMNEILEELGTVEDYTGRGWLLTLSNPTIEKENLSLDDALKNGRTYDAPWYLTATLSDPIKNVKKEQTIYMGDMPVMTKNGTFVINGVERVIINQLRRSEGILFTAEVSPISGQLLGGAKVLPKNGAWLEIETSRSGVISVKIDRKRKMSITTLLRVFGLETNDDIIKAFANYETNPEVNYIKSTLAKDPSNSYDEACIEIYRKMRPGEPLVLENAKSLVEALFFNFRRYSLGKVGRFKLNQVLELNYPNDLENRLLQLEDLIRIVGGVIQINNGVKDPSDVDHLANRRVLSVGELLQAQVRVGFLQMERNIKEKMALAPKEDLPEPATLISPRTVTAKIHSFFATGQLSQFQDQQNTLTALEHLRRVSLTGPGGLSRERAGFQVRDVHYSSFGRICPVRTPEGPSIGMINYLAMYARINEYGFIETPYIRLEKEADGRVRVTDEIVYLAAYDEMGIFITDSTIETDKDGYIIADQIALRNGGEFSLGDTKQAQYMEVAPRQIVGVSAGLIPYVGNDDVARALIATQQMSQAVPLVKPQAPLVGTGIEAVVAENTGAICTAEEAGVVTYSDANKVVIKYDAGTEATYKTVKFVKSNHSTCLNQNVKVAKGDKVEKGTILFEGPSITDGEMAIGTNVTAAYMVWEGLEFEDGIVISDRLVKDDTLTSIHISEHSTKILETKLGPEEITADIPNVAEEVLRNLDEAGIVAVGSKVKAGDILVGKVAPKGEADLSAEERLLRAIFGEKAKDVRDNSLRMPHGEHGVVIGVKRVTKKENEDLTTGVLEEITVYVAQQKKIEIGDKLAGRHGNKGVISAIVPDVDMPRYEDGTPVDVVFSAEAVIKRMNVGQILESSLGKVAAKLGKTYAVPSFEIIKDEDVKGEYEQAGISMTGKAKLIDGRTGRPFDGEIVVGTTYLLKLYHMSEDKMHARSTGPYSLITQQPLGGKSQFGGQRFGEMEVWALEAYGAAHVLREMLTIKSDDLVGRTQAYSAIIKGETIPESTVPETFKLLVRQLNGLVLGIETIGGDTQLDISTEEGVKQLLASDTPVDPSIFEEIVPLAEEEPNIFLTADAEEGEPSDEIEGMNLFDPSTDAIETEAVEEEVKE